MRNTLIEVIASFPVYRTYIRPETGVLSPADRSYLSRALAAAHCLQPPPSPPVLRLLSNLLHLRLRGNLETDFVLRFQQLTGPAMAKGVEDTAFYCFNRFGALNEVGGNPARFGSTLAAFHRAYRHTRRRWPDTMLTTSTHDTKRSEDVRARLALLSEIPNSTPAR